MDWERIRNILTIAVSITVIIGFLGGGYLYVREHLSAEEIRGQYSEQDIAELKEQYNDVLDEIKYYVNAIRQIEIKQEGTSIAVQNLASTQEEIKDALQENNQLLRELLKSYRQ